MRIKPLLEGRDIGQGLVQGCASAGRRVESHLVQVQYLYWAVHFTCADCGALLAQQPVKFDVPYGGRTVGRFKVPVGFKNDPLWQNSRYVDL